MTIQPVTCPVLESSKDNTDLLFDSLAQLAFEDRMLHMRDNEDMTSALSPSHEAAFNSVLVAGGSRDQAAVSADKAREPYISHPLVDY